MSHTHTTQGGSSFSGLGLSPRLLDVLAQLKFTTPTPIQHQAIPVAVAGKDVMGIAQTGTGKTLAFVLPLLQQLKGTRKRGLVIVPTRELAAQVAEVLEKVGRPVGARHALVIGGASMHKQVGDIRRDPHVIIGTPGRIIDHLQQKSLRLQDVGVLVLDEADRMLDMGFAPQIAQILKHVPRERQTMLFSATMPPAIVKLAAAHMKMPVRVEVAPAGTVAELVNHELFVVQKLEKGRLLDKLLGEYRGTVLVFARTKYGAKKICRLVNQLGHSAAEIHSNLSLSQRRRSLAGFKSGTYRVLVATDIAARGIDVTDIELVINYDLPDNLDDYVHRVGRTGRAGKTGQAISFVTPDQRGDIRTLERLVRRPLKVSALPQLPGAQHEQPQREHHQPFRRERRHHQPRHHRQRHPHPGRRQPGGRRVRLHT